MQKSTPSRRRDAKAVRSHGGTAPGAPTDTNDKRWQDIPGAQPYHRATNKPPGPPVKKGAQTRPNKRA